MHPARGRGWLTVAAYVVLALLLTQCGFHSGGSSGTGASGNVAASSLPSQAQDTLRLIDQGGPFPYDQDGVVFENREGLLPHESTGYYHEYTVVTPGSSDRGARRIIAGSHGELYYTADHYRTFERITR